MKETAKFLKVHILTAEQKAALVESAELKAVTINEEQTEGIIGDVWGAFWQNKLKGDLPTDIMISALALVRRLSTLLPKAKATINAERNIRSTLITCISLSDRLVSKRPLDWGEEGGFSANEMRQLEKKMVRLLKENILVSPHAYELVAKKYNTRTKQSVVPTKEDQKRVVEEVKASVVTGPGAATKPDPAAGLASPKDWKMMGFNPPKPKATTF